MQTTPNPEIVKLDDEKRAGIDFGDFKLGEIRGVVFNDTNNNTFKDANETGLSNWTVKLAGTNGNFTAKTNFI